MYTEFVFVLLHDNTNFGLITRIVMCSVSDQIGDVVRDVFQHHRIATILIVHFGAVAVELASVAQRPFFEFVFAQPFGAIRFV